MTLAKNQRKQLRRLAHDLKAIIRVGQHGLTGNVVEEVSAALEHHELLKIKVQAADRSSRDLLIQQLCAATGAEQVQRVGNVVTLFKTHPERPRFRLTD